LVLIFSIFIFSFNFVIAVPSKGLPNLTNASGELTTFGQKSGFETDEDKVDIDVVIGSVIKYALSFLGVIFLVLLIYGGFIWMLARGDAEEVKKSKDIMTNAIIGIGIVLGAYLLTNWIIASLVSTTLS
jgi:hypothetical protein